MPLTNEQVTSLKEVILRDFRAEDLSSLLRHFYETNNLLELQNYCKSIIAQGDDTRIMQLGLLCQKLQACYQMDNQITASSSDQGPKVFYELAIQCFDKVIEQKTDQAKTAALAKIVLLFNNKELAKAKADLMLLNQDPAIKKIALNLSDIYQRDQMFDAAIPLLKEFSFLNKKTMFGSSWRPLIKDSNLSVEASIQLSDIMALKFVNSQNYSDGSLLKESILLKAYAATKRKPTDYDLLCKIFTHVVANEKLMHVMRKLMTDREVRDKLLHWEYDIAIEQPIKPNAPVPDARVYAAYCDMVTEKYTFLLRNFQLPQSMEDDEELQAELAGRYLSDRIDPSTLKTKRELFLFIDSYRCSEKSIQDRPEFKTLYLEKLAMLARDYKNLPSILEMMKYYTDQKNQNLVDEFFDIAIRNKQDNMDDSDKVFFAQIYRMHGDYNDAITLLLELNNKLIYNTNASYVLADTYMQVGNYDAALAYSLKAAQHEDLASMQQVADIYLDLKDLPQADLWLNKIIEVKIMQAERPSSHVIELGAKLVIKYIESDDLDNSEKWLKKLHTFPLHQAGINALGNAHYLLAKKYLARGDQKLYRSYINNLIAATDCSYEPAEVELSKKLEEKLSAENHQLIMANFLCSITQSFTSQPAITTAGNTYSIRAISTWIRDKKTDPLTGMALKKINNRYFYDNLPLKSLLHGIITSAGIFDFKTYRGFLDSDRGDKPFVYPCLNPANGDTFEGFNKEYAAAKDYIPNFALKNIITEVFGEQLELPSPAEVASAKVRRKGPR